MEWFCKGCFSVTHAKSFNCCGEVESFDLQKHGRSLISGSNSWETVWSKLKDTPFLREVSRELGENNCQSAPIALLTAFEKLIEERDDYT